jgi:hypothetical protein
VGSNACLPDGAAGCVADSPSVEFSVNAQGALVPDADDPTRWTAAIEIDAEQYLHNSEAGTTAGHVYRQGDAGHPDDSLGADLTLLRATKLTMEDVPRHAKKGKKISVGGYLRRADWDKVKYVDYQHVRGTLQFRTKKGHYKTIRSAWSGQGVQGGALYVFVKASKDGCFRWKFAGSGTTAATTAHAACVDVR